MVGLLAAGSLPVSLLLHNALGNSRFLVCDGFAKRRMRSLGTMLIISSIHLLLLNKLRFKTASQGTAPETDLSSVTAPPVPC
jgi:hypothetical protein